MRRELFEKLEHELVNSTKHKTKKIKLNLKEREKSEIKPCFSFYTNNLSHLKEINNVKRVYLEIPPEYDDLNIIHDEKYNLNHMINFLKEAIEISMTKDYELIWKWPDIAHDKLIKTLNKVRGILNKMHYTIPIMSNNFKGEYGPYSMNITNTETIKSLENYKILTLSPELTKKDYEDIIKFCESQNQLEILVQGSVELMKTRYSLLYGKEIKKAKNNSKNFLIDRNNRRYPIHKSISGEELILFNCEDLSLLKEIEHLKHIGFSNFSIDGRWKDNCYYKIIEIYESALKGNINEKELLKYSPKNTIGNY